MTSMTFHFRKIYEIFIFKLFDFFVRSFVFLTVFHDIRVILFYLSICLDWLHSTHRHLTVDKIFFFLTLLESESRIFLLSKKISMCSNFRVNFFNFLRKKTSKEFRNIALRKCECNACRKLKYFWYFSKNSNNCVFNFSICVISSSIDWLNFCLTCFNF